MTELSAEQIAEMQERMTRMGNVYHPPLVDRMRQDMRALLADRAALIARLAEVERERDELREHLARDLSTALVADGHAGTLTGNLAADMAAYATRLKARAEQAEAALAAMKRGYNTAVEQVEAEMDKRIDAEAALAVERAKVADVRKALADLGGDNGYGGSQCGVCGGHSPSWDGHSRNCKRAFPDRVRAALDPGATTTAQDDA